MLKNFVTVGSWTLVSRLLGLVRDQLLAIFLGAGMAQDAFQIAFRLPNMFRRLFGEGAFNAAFVPIFTEKLTTDGQKAARQFASNAFSWLAIWLTCIAILGEIFMPWVIAFIAPGFSADGSRFDLAVKLSRITFPYLVLICLAALVAGVLNGLNRFALAAAAYVAFNIVGIAAILLGAYVFHAPVIAAAWGITASGVLQLAILLWSSQRCGMHLSLHRPIMNPAIRTTLKRLTPGLVGSGVTQLNLTVDTMIATLLPAGSISWLYFADRVNQLPLGVLGAAAGTTLLPVLTRYYAAQDHAGGVKTLNKAIDYALLLTLPSCLGLIALAPTIMSALFGYGRFTTSDTVFAAQSLRAYALGLPAFVLIKVLSPAFFASGDTKTPVRIGFLILALNLGLNLSLYRPLGHIGPPLASTIAAAFNLGLLWLVLKRRALLRLETSTLHRGLKILIASSIMAGVIFTVTHFFLGAFSQFHVFPRLAALAVILSLGGGVYLTCLMLFGIVRAQQLLTLRRNR